MMLRLHAFVRANNYAMVIFDVRIVLLQQSYGTNTESCYMESTHCAPGVRTEFVTTVEDKCLVHQRL